MRYIYLYFGLTNWIKIGMAAFCTASMFVSIKYIYCTCSSALHYFEDGMGNKPELYTVTV